MGFGISQATAYRYKDEAVEVLAAKAPSLREALDKAVEQGLPDGTLVSSDAARTRRPAVRGRRSISGIPARPMSPPGTSRRWPPRAACRCGSATWCPAAPTT